MTMDDGNSIYVGGLPYDITEESLRRVFSVYGNIHTIKIVNDRSVRGKCYGFVTFSNRRSADEAIAEMDGKNIGGRAVRVNEVTTRGGGGDRGRFDEPRGGSMDRRSDCNYDRDQYSDRSRERDRSLDRRREYDVERERAYEHSREFERRKEHDMVERNGYKERGFDDGERDWRGDRDNNGWGIHGTSAHEGRSPDTKRDDSTTLEGGRGRDHFSSSSGDHNFQVKEDLEALIKKREALHNEVLVMEDRLEEKEIVCSELQKKSKRLEDLLIDEKKLTTQRRKELAKLYKLFTRVRECTDNLKDCEQELQSLVSSAAREGMAVADGLGNGYM